MQYFTIRDIEHLTGIRAHTLRIWEQRYQFFKAKRKESSHRYYDNEDLKKLIRVAYLYNHGWKISRIATLSDQDLSAEVLRKDTVRDTSQLFINLLIEAAINFNEDKFKSILDDAIGQLGFEKTVISVCYPFLGKLGLLWASNNAIPAQEHFSSYLIQNRIILETGSLPSVQKPHDIILICPQGEYHELPLLFINYLLKKKGACPFYMGANISLNELKAVSDNTSVRSIYLHLITNFTGLSADEYLENLCGQFRDTTIYASGEGIKQVQRTFTNLVLLRNDEQIHRFIEQL